MKRQSTEKVEEGVVKKSKRYMSVNKLNECCSQFLSNKKHANVLIDLLNQLQIPTETPVECVTAVENVFIEILKRKDITKSDEDNISEAECQYKEWLGNCYEDAWIKLALCLQKGSSECKLQALNSMFQLLSNEAKFPLTQEKKKKRKKNFFPVKRLKIILESLSLSSNLSTDLSKRFSEFLSYKDVGSNLWLSLESLLKDMCQQQPNDKRVWNILLLLSGLPKLKKGSDNVFCDIKNGVPEDKVVRTAVNSVWKLLAPWHYSSRTHQLLLVVLVEYMMPQMDCAIYLTDYFMDCLNRDECEISMLALQGVFNLIIKHNIEYPNIYGKLYQLFTVETLKAKYKTRLFALADEFLRSTHLPLTLVAAFAKRFSRLLLVASPPDMLILLTFIANLLIRHPNLKFLCHNPNGKDVDDDVYNESEKDPVKSGASQSQLWEVKLLQQHPCERVAKLARSISDDLPSVEYQLEPLLDLTWQKMIKRDIKNISRKIPVIAEKFEDKPLSNKMEEARQKEFKILFSEISKLFVF
ncbi:nucleolar complex protein 4 homolog [Homalodisca vitripennis]|uniref:nucleolar complex protein 4 homolog n=1 Tax=Homalodisca vitripennis TaxID=197043 RepID=UPI001EEA8934|nr:nucleolar complex protein 4 homolog [Homalodisca vitripennis]